MMHALPRWVLLSIVTVGLVGCGSGPETVSRRQALVESADAAQLGYTIQWGSDINVAPDSRLQTAVWLEEADMVVLIEEPDSLVVAVSPREGRILWRSQVGRRTTRLFTPVYYEGKLYVNSETHLYQLNPKTGEVEVVQELESVVQTSPAVIYQFAVFGSADGLIFGHSLETGFAKWRQRTVGGVLAPPVAIGTKVVVVDTAGTYQLLDGGTGEVLRKARTFDAITTKPAYDNHLIYLTSRDQKVYAIDQVTGYARWTRPMGQRLTTPPRLFDDALYIRLPGRGLVSLATEDGSERWRISHDATPILQTERGLLLNATTSLLWVDPSSGQTIYQVPVLRLYDVLVGPENRLILVSPQGRLLRLDPRTR